MIEQRPDKNNPTGLPLVMVFGERDKVAVVYLEDILIENTRKVRRSLLVLSFVALVGTTTGLTPKTVFGLEFGQANRRLLFCLLAAAILYHLVVFVVDGWRDLLMFSRRADIASATYSEVLREEDPESHHSILGLESLKKDERHVFLLRFFLQMILPLLVGLTGFVASVWGAAGSAQVHNFIRFVFTLFLAALYVRGKAAN